MPRVNKIQVRRDTAANLASVNPTPLVGEPILDLTNNRLKYGDGTTAYTSLPYHTPKSSISETAPSSPAPGDFWVKGGVVYAYSGSAWVSLNQFIIQRSIEGVVYETTLMYWVAPATCTVNMVSMSLSSNPSATGSYCKVQVMKNGLQNNYYCR